MRQEEGADILELLHREPRPPLEQATSQTTDEFLRFLGHELGLDHLVGHVLRHFLTMQDGGAGNRAKRAPLTAAKLLGIQTQIGGREWRTLCAISSTAILHRKKMPKDVADKVVKTEFVAKKAKELIGSLRGGLLKGRPWFSMQELENIGTFLLTHTATVQTEPEKPAEVTALNEPIPSAAPVSEPAPRSYVVTDAERLAAESPADTAVPTEKLLTCKQCGEADNLVGMYGQ